jgi:hypothetical protein
MGPNRRALEREAAAAREAEAKIRRTTDKMAREDAERAVVERNARLAANVPIWTVPTIGAALTAARPWLAISCPGCGTITDIDLRTIDRHPDAAVTRLVLSLRCRVCNGRGPMPQLLGLSQIKPEPKREDRLLG